VTRARRIAGWLKWLVPLAAAFFIGRIIYGQWAKVREFDWTWDPWFLAFSFAATSVWFFVRAWVWRRIAHQFGTAIPYPECVRIFALAELSRYVPGTVWQYLSRIYLAGRWGLPAAAAITASLMDVLLLALAAAPLVLWHIAEVFPLMERAQRILFGVFPFAAIALLQPAVLNALARVLLPRLRQPYLPIRFGFWELFGLWASYLGLWISFGSGFALFARSLAPVGVSQGLELMSNYAISWLTGLLTPFTPGGLVVREAILGLLLGRMLPLGTALVVAVLSRLWLITLELFWAAVAQIYLRRSPPAMDAGAGEETRR